MTRSRRKTPVVGFTTCESEKKDKRLANRALRRAVKVSVLAGNEVMPRIDDVSNVAAMGKDGKQRIDPVKHSKLMRK